LTIDPEIPNDEIRLVVKHDDDFNARHLDTEGMDANPTALPGNGRFSNLPGSPYHA